MQALMAHSAFWRGMAVFAGMLIGKALGNADRGKAAGHRRGLVSWSGNAQSRRQDELVRYGHHDRVQAP